MIARSHSAGILGVEAFLITVEAEVGLGLPGLRVVGQATGAANESRERVRAALSHCGHDIPPRKQIVNLAPAEMRKDSPGVDLAIALALIAAYELVPAQALASCMAWGELALDGSLRPVAGALVVADAARRAGLKTIYVALEDAPQAALVPGLEVVGVRSLAELVAALRGERVLPPFETPPSAALSRRSPDMADVRGLVLPRLAVEVMAAGGHNLLLHGPPGVGKTMLARRAVGLLPRLDPEAALEVTRIHGVSGGSKGSARRALIQEPPIRMPHHTVSVAGLLGGGSPPRPGEVSLAHRGLLFLDELPEFPRSCLEGMREPLEDGEVSLVRAKYAVTLPARFQLMAAMNPCPCGYLGHPDRSCVCSHEAVARYQRKVSGPFMDRMDLVVPVSPTKIEELDDAPPGESSEAVRARVMRARDRQSERLEGTPWRMNAEVPAQGSALQELCALDGEAQELLRGVATARNWSPRVMHRVRRVARTLADLREEGRERAGKAEVGAAAALHQPPSMVV